MAAGTTTTGGVDASKPFFHTKLFINNEVSDLKSYSQPREWRCLFKSALLCSAATTLTIKHSTFLPNQASFGQFETQPMTLSSLKKSIARAKKMSMMQLPQQRPHSREHGARWRVVSVRKSC
jgi:hypothetical protein